MVSKLVIAVCIMAIIVGPSIVPEVEAGLFGKVFDKVTCPGCEWTKKCYHPDTEAEYGCLNAFNHDEYDGRDCPSFRGKFRPCGVDNGGKQFLCSC